MPSLRAILIGTAIAAAAPAAAAQAAWNHSGAGQQTAKAVSMPTGNQPTASVSNRSVTVSWTASTMPGGGSVGGYVVTRYDTNGNAQTVGAGCSGTIAALTCTETSVPGGTWRYTVTPVLGSWSGGESAQSASVTVASPSLSFSSSTTLTSLPTTLSGSIAAFVGGQTVTFRLDDQTSGTVLASSVSPSPLPSGGGASVTVTVPAGTANGSHTIYAIGSGGDVASAAITVSVTYTATTSAYDLRDASSGIEANKSEAIAFSADSLTLVTGLWSSAFSNTRYFDFNMNSPLPAGFSVSGANFNVTYAAAASTDTACYWFEVRSASTGNVIAGGTHGSSASPVDCTTGTTLKSVSTAISELDTTNEANDLRIRVYGRESGGKAFTLDRGTVTGSSQSTSFTLYPDSWTDASTGTATTTTWGLSASGGAAYTTASAWSTSFTTSRYLKLTFPGYVPSTATVTGATFKLNYRPTTSGSTHNACYYLEVYSGATLIGTHGSSAAPISCNSTSTYTPDSVTLSEINTAARANGAIVKVYFRVSSSATQTDQDLATLGVSYK